MLIEKQALMHDRIRQNAIIKGLGEGKAFPILDGAFYPVLYEAAKEKVLIIGYEGYDSYINDTLVGGGHTIDYWLDRTDNGLHTNPRKASCFYRMLIYLLYGIYLGIPYEKNTLNYYDILKKDGIHHVDTLERAALININKMPAWSRSNPQEVMRLYEQNWSEIVTDQIKLYNPTIIIACGNSLLFPIKNAIPVQQISRYDYTATDKDKFYDINNPKFYNSFNSIVDGYISEGKVIIHCYHPGYHLEGLTNQIYIDSILETIEGIKERI